MREELRMVDVLIVGSGIAGATVALKVAAKYPKAKILMLTRAASPNESNTWYAQGGIIAKGGRELVEDIFRAGDEIGLREAAQVLAEEGPLLVNEILSQTAKVPFDKTGDGNLDYALEGGHSEPRIAKVSDYTGKSIQEHLSDALARCKNIEVLTNVTAIDLLTLSHHSNNWSAKYDSEKCVGVYAFDQEDGKVSRILAKKTVLATGGTGQIYAHTTNPSGARGDGIAMAHRAGARVINLEFEQFHPTALKLTGAPPFLISEAVRGLGARLTNSLGEPFMQRYYPDLEKPDLTTRDKVSQAIFKEMLLTGTTNVYLDAKSYISKEEIKKHFPVIYEKCLSYGIDMTKELIPVSPAAHYCCGGVLTDLNGKTSIENLFAVGEVSCTGLHGGNRLASTSLLEGLVFGNRAALEMMKEGLESKPWGDEKYVLEWKNQGKYEADPNLIAADMNSVRNIMWNMVGLVRKTWLLERAISDLVKMEDSINRFYRKSILNDDLLGLRNAVLVALLTARSAFANNESIGCHYLED